MANRKLGNASITSATRMIVESVGPAEVPGDGAEQPADDERQRHRGDGDDERDAGAVDDA